MFKVFWDDLSEATLALPVCCGIPHYNCDRATSLLSPLDSSLSQESEKPPILTPCPRRTTTRPDRRVGASSAGTGATTIGFPTAHSRAPVPSARRTPQRPVYGCIAQGCPMVPRTPTARRRRPGGICRNLPLGWYRFSMPNPAATRPRPATYAGHRPGRCAADCGCLRYSEPSAGMTPDRCSRVAPVAGVNLFECCEEEGQGNRAAREMIHAPHLPPGPPWCLRCPGRVRRRASDCRHCRSFPAHLA